MTADDITVLFLLGVIGSSIWVAFDAQGRNVGSAGLWFVGCLLLWIVAFPMYLAQRGKKPAAFQLPPQQATVLPGWYPDPHVPGKQRWWDGQRWTEHTY